MIASEMHQRENDASAELRRRSFVESCLAFAKIDIPVSDVIVARARALQQQGIKPEDSLHLSVAEAAQASHFITCDDHLIRRYHDQVVTALNPQTFITVVGSYED